MKNLIYTTLFLFCYLQANGQDYLQLANECFDKGDYECAKRNYTFFQTFDGKDISAQIQKTEECLRILNLADDYFKDAEWEKARERYKIVLEKNPNDPHAKKQFDLCEENLKSKNYELLKQAQEDTPSSKKKKKFHYGLKLGLNVSNIAGKNARFYNFSNRTDIHGGVFGDFKFNKFAIQPELLYSRQGGKEKLLEYFTIPIMAKYYFIEGLSIEIGPQIDIEKGRDLPDCIDFSLNFGASYQLSRFPLGFYVRYSYGLDILYSGTYYFVNFENRVYQVGTFYKF